MNNSFSISIQEQNQIGEARRLVAGFGVEFGLSEATKNNLNIVITELGTNLAKHARQGELIIRHIDSSGSDGIEVISLDRGPGMKDVAQCMRDGFSTSGTSGNGLGSIRRLSTTFDIYSSQLGTLVVAQLMNSIPDIRVGLEIGAICLPMKGEQDCGDGWSCFQSGNSQTLMVADGLGHGTEAAEAANQALRVLTEAECAPEKVLNNAHAALKATRGAATLVLQIRACAPAIVCCGVGNISAGVYSGSQGKSFVSMNGIVGHQVSRFQEFTYEWDGTGFLIVHTDGIQTKWKLADYPGLQMKHPSIIAGVIFRDFRRDRDDSTVIVAKRHREGTQP